MQRIIQQNEIRLKNPPSCFCFPLRKTPITWNHSRKITFFDRNGFVNKVRPIRAGRAGSYDRFLSALAPSPEKKTSFLRTAYYDCWCLLCLTAAFELFSVRFRWKRKVIWRKIGRLETKVSENFDSCQCVAWLAYTNSWVKKPGKNLHSD